jgi:hypothetical protein
MNYFDKNGQILFVSQGLGLNEWGTFRKNPRTMGHHRVKSPMMPMVATMEEAQRNLDAYAKKNGLKPSE